ncbi:MAG: tRNA (adenosine(37)-N6)-threonylcarbamoyltransferase complex transferase subunit TsaD [Acidobacteriota bacterium]|nr:tRNA (adenosine(37)-N6)-threonylcarbamoyltransferase complex transferase subunit TsaD [Acidobacteriota bacterium]
MGATGSASCPLVLGIETSCDDTCAAVVGQDGVVHSNVISSQHVHDRFGGVVPEVASRHHLDLMNVVIGAALGEAGVDLGAISLVGVTRGPGLIGALLVGLSAAKALAAARELPLAAVDHIQGHVAANFLSLAGEPPFEPPFLCLIASGGHTLLAEVAGHDGFALLGQTLDDAAGEAFDKGARMLGLGYPGGAALEDLARDGDPGAFAFPVGGRRHRPGAGSGAVRFAQTLDFSFAGVKTALWQRLKALGEGEREERRADLAASYQAAIVEGLMVRVEQALERTGSERLAIGGGVAANGELRRRVGALGVAAHIPARVLCTDNAAMIASAARYGDAMPYPAYLGLDAYASGEAALGTRRAAVVAQATAAPGASAGR